MSDRGIECGDLFVGELMGWTPGRWANALFVWRIHGKELPKPTLDDARIVQETWMDWHPGIEPETLREGHAVRGTYMLWVMKVFVETALANPR